MTPSADKNIADVRKIHKSRDLKTAPFSVTSSQDWTHPEKTLTGLFRCAESYAIEVSDWYLADKRIKRRVSQTLRAGAIFFGVAGSLVPLLQIATPNLLNTAWGYVLIALSAACIAFDKFFGISAAWMRDIGGTQAVQRRLAQFQYDWAAQSINVPTTPREIENRLTDIKSFIADIQNIIATETGQWETEFRSAVDELARPATTSTIS